ncbi:MAG: S-adenosylmethionine:tRNA ribosyltransferase-isomerase [Salinivirgaceae bacterium]|jgi:S-adenosylmethionine:tRNA ribosyltransferase-isomerase|nr:S-adenosylmethionine:tRNA ribosyltransferase-isomerase [Salinivirgaceae bacterium]
MNTHIDINNYDYYLPEQKIAKYPLAKRDHSKMLYYNAGSLQDKHFYDLPDLLPDNAALYFNNTRVLYARLPFVKSTGANIEVFCLEPHAPADYAINLQNTQSCQWKCLVGNLKKWKTGSLILKGHEHLGLEASIVSREQDYVVVEFTWQGEVAFADILSQAGGVPIPPYLNRKAEEQDKKTYQTLYSRIDGSVAAPTAGLHFTSEILEHIKKRGIPSHEVTLHVGAGTFRPVSSNSVDEHEMHQEYIHVNKATILALLANKHAVYAVGTTTVRTLESIYWIGVSILQKMPEKVTVFEVEQWAPYKNSKLPSRKAALEAILDYMEKYDMDSINGSTQIIIVPGYKHQVVKGLITNFHQPRSTLLLLLASFVGEFWKTMYDHALNEDYRFLSYGDSCFIKV